MDDPQVVRRPITRVTGGAIERFEDSLAIERALEIHVDGRALTVTLRTPGHDDELVAGFLAGEGVIRRAADLAAVALAAARCSDEPDLAEVRLAPGVRLDWSRLERNFAASSACGLCGRAHLEALRSGLEPLPPGPSIDSGALLQLPQRLQDGQVTFSVTGGLHAAAWCGPDLAPLVLREDVGRHNAVDKVVGWMLANGRYPAGPGVLWVSGRAGAEIVLKAARARIAVLAAVGAPSSLAAELAASAGMTLVGFLREGRMNVYSGEARLALAAGSPARRAPSRSGP